ncbi:MAG: pseudouridine synthase [Hyphomicrobiaceae bacterium]
MAKDDKGQWRPKGRPTRASRHGGSARPDGDRDGGAGEARAKGYRPRKPATRPPRNSDIKTWRAEPADDTTPRRPSLEERTRHLRPKREGGEPREDRRERRSQDDRKSREGNRDGERRTDRDTGGYRVHDGGRRETRGYVSRERGESGPRRERDDRTHPAKPRSTAGDGFRTRADRERPSASGGSRVDRQGSMGGHEHRKRGAETPRKAGAPSESMRISKAMARAGLCSRRDAERWIEEGRVSVNGAVITSPALDVGPADRVLVDGSPLPPPEPVRLWRYHKPKGLVTTHSDPEGRATVFAALPADMPRVISVGRLDYSTEGLLLITTSGAVARHLELPTTGWLRRYRVRAFGVVAQERLDTLKDGVEIDGVAYGPVEATLDTVQGSNVWLTIGLREGKNREVRNILASLGLEVNRLIRVSYGPFQLLDLEPGKLEIVRRKVLAEQLGPELAAELGLDGEADEAERLPPRQGFRLRPLPGPAREQGATRHDHGVKPRSSGYRARDVDGRNDRKDSGSRGRSGSEGNERDGKPPFKGKPSGFRARGFGDREQTASAEPRERGGKPPFKGKSSGFRARGLGDRERTGGAEPRERDGKPPFKGKPSGFRARGFGDREQTASAEPRERGGKPPFKGKPSGFRARGFGDREQTSGAEPRERGGKPPFEGKPSGYRDRDTNGRDRGGKAGFKGRSGGGHRGPKGTGPSGGKGRGGA